MHKSALFIVATLLAVGGCRAADGRAGTSAAELVRLLKYDEQYQASRQACTDMTASVSPEVVVRQEPDRFYGIRPGSRKWPEVMKAWQLYTVRVCAHPSREEYIAAATRSYASRLDAKTLADAIAFYSSPAGQKIVAGMHAADHDIVELQRKAYAAQTLKADAEFTRRMVELAK